MSEKRNIETPHPIGVILVPVIAESSRPSGILAVRRKIDPYSGQLALPGGHIHVGETWRVGAARELAEETGIKVESPENMELVAAESTPDGNYLLLFGLISPVSYETIDDFSENDEVSELIVLEKPTPLCFDLHTIVLESFFER